MVKAPSLEPCDRDRILVGVIYILFLISMEPNSKSEIEFRHDI